MRALNHLVACLAGAALLSACGGAKLPPPDRSGLPAPGPVKAWAPPPVTTWTMKNKLEVWYLRQSQAPLISMHLVLPNGAATDPAGKAGVTAMMVDMLDEGAGARDALQISQRWKSLASDFGASPATDGVFFSMDLLADKLEPSLALFADIVLRPTFPPAEFERRKAQTLAQAIAREADPGTARMLTSRRALYSKGYGGMPAGGVRDTLTALTLDDVKAQYAAVVKPEGGRLIVVGDVDQATLKAALQKAFGEWSGAPTAKARPVNRMAAPPTLHVIDFPGSTQSAITVARRCPGAKAEDRFAVQVFNRALGGAFTSRVNLNLREDKGYTYGARSGFNRWREGGMFTIGAKVKSQTTRASLDEIFKELKGIRGDKPLTQKERDSAVNNLLLGFPGRFESMSSVAGQLSWLALVDLPADALQTFTQTIAGVSREQAAKAGNAYTDPASFQIIVAGDWNALKGDLEGLGLPVLFHDPQGNPKPVVKAPAEPAEPGTPEPAPKPTGK